MTGSVAVHWYCVRNSDLSSLFYITLGGHEWRPHTTYHLGRLFAYKFGS